MYRNDRTRTQAQAKCSGGDCLTKDEHYKVKGKQGTENMKENLNWSLAKQRNKCNIENIAKPDNRERGA